VQHLFLNDGENERFFCGVFGWILVLVRVLVWLFFGMLLLNRELQGAMQPFKRLIKGGKNFGLKLNHALSLALSGA
jgi:hypothetical protein